MNFEEADQLYLSLRHQYNNGSLSADEFETRLKEEIMVPDTEGNWWSKHPQTGDWYYHDGSTWVQGTPPNYEPVVDESVGEQEELNGASHNQDGDPGVLVAPPPDKASSGDEEHPRPMPSLRVLVALGLVGLALLGLVGILIVATSDPQVPDVVGQTESEAARTVGNDYTIHIESVRVDDQRKGHIISQDPEPGESAEQGSAISVVVSAGQPPNPGDILSDDFSDTSSGWDESEGSKFEPWIRDYSGGQYRLYMTPPAEPLPSLRAGKAVEDGIVEVDAALQSDDPGTDASWGVICRAQDKNNYYVFRISADKRPSIWRKVDDRYTPLFAKGSSSDTVYGGKEINHLRADCIGSKLTFYVNNQKVAEVEDQTFTSGQVGLEAENAEGEPIEVAFDNYSVSSP